MFGAIRTTTNERGEPLFVGKDVAEALGYSNTRDALRKHVDSEDKDAVAIRDSIGRDQQTIFITESGLYSLILSSKLAQAKAFKRWVTAEVLPQIRRTGGYIPTHDAEGRELSPEEILRRAEDIIGRTLRMLNAPSCNCLTATEVARSWGMDVKVFNRLLADMGIQRRQGGRWHLTERLEGRGMTEDRFFAYYSLNGRRRSRTYLVWTAKGVSYLNSRVRDNAITDRPVAIQLNIFVENGSKGNLELRIKNQTFRSYGDYLQNH